jgi:hypothetical protein
VYDATFKGPEIIDVPMTATMIGYSSLFVRFAWAVNPRNYILFACHAFNVTAQLNQMRRAIEYKLANVPNAPEELASFTRNAGLAVAGLVGLIATSGRISKVFTKDSMPGFVRNIAAHPAGPFTIFFWAPTSKWLLSANNLVDLNKPTDKMSLSQQLALTSTGLYM